MHVSPKNSRKLISLLTIGSIIIILLLVVYWYRLGIFTSETKMRAYLADKKIIGPLLFLLIQVVQVVIPVIPGGVSLLAGVVFFGPVMGFVYNYVGICIGSIINFFLARYYGKPFILYVVSEETLDKYMQWTKNQKKFNCFFAVCILAPVAPDDVLCLIAGLTEMKVSTYLWIIFLAKPWTIAVYSLGLAYGSHWLTHLIGQ
ncbi:MAG: VTT domain-containing protein [Lactobacillus sp.]|nr:VTT domain-containing protein [Lactobacillus sp.]MDN6043104.1 VTT domain-containing protein [Lactobacillus sp.]MDN6052847.1 VTT domain-containing protein [Lactobacillus sp.]